MSFLTFFLYMTLCIIIYGIIGVLLYKFILKKKFSFDNSIEKQLDDFFNNYNNDLESEKEDNDKKIYSSF